MQEFGRALTEELASAGLSHHEAARKTGVPQGTVSALCSGTRNPSLSTAARLMVHFPRLLLWFACYVRSLGRGDEP
jgi:plasmid maintenance system antidote protein VapI